MFTALLKIIASLCAVFLSNMENIHEKIRCAVFLEKGLAAVTRGNVRLLIAPYWRLEAKADTPQKRKALCRVQARTLNCVIHACYMCAVANDARSKKRVEGKSFVARCVLRRKVQKKQKVVELFLKDAALAIRKLQTAPHCP